MTLLTLIAFTRFALSALWHARHGAELIGERIHAHK